ncbi:MAG: hypothetical protein RSA55_07400 [Clostridia bacterium]
MERILNEFEVYCQTPGIDSGKARSYAKAIQYLCNFFETSQIDQSTVTKIKNSEQYLSDPNSILYKDTVDIFKEPQAIIIFREKVY